MLVKHAVNSKLPGLKWLQPCCGHAFRVQCCHLVCAANGPGRVSVGLTLRFMGRCATSMLSKLAYSILSSFTCCLAESNWGLAVAF